MEFPNKKYSIIYADPPWLYNDKCHSGNRGAEYKYDCMTIDDICSLPIKEITNDDAILFLWTTWPQIFNAEKVIRAWGFKYKSIGFIWVKKNKKAIDTNFWGMGNWTRANTEPCLLAVKGKPKRMSARVHFVIESPIRNHSKKPDEIRSKIVELIGDLPRLEIFARNHIDGWDTWGNEI